MSSTGTPMVHYEVYTLSGQRWTLHARFRQDERDDALEEAKTVERSLGIAAKVIRETYFPTDNVSEEQTIYAGDQALRQRAAMAPAFRGRGHGRPVAAESGKAPVRGKAKQASGSMGNLLKLLMIVAASLTLAGGLTGVINIFFAKLPDYGMPVNPQTVSLLQFATFVVTFLATGLPLATSMLDWGDGRARPAKERRPAPPRRAPLTEPSPPPPAPTEELEKVEEEIEFDLESPEDNEPLPPVPEEPPVEAAEQKPEEDEETPAEDAPAAAAAVGEDGMTVETCQLLSMRFLSAMLSEVKKIRPTLDAYNKFGVDLVMAGAIDVLGTQNRQDIEQKRQMLKAAIEVMGTRPETAKAFADKYEDYLMEPRYMAMVQAGRSAMEAFLAAGEAPPSEMGKTFELWNRPTQGTQAAPRIMTVLFTDMVGSTDLTQAQGDQAAQHLVRRHNSIVRGALAEFSGKEIKHTGDGIMASFASAANGVEAAVSIQRQVAEHNRRQPMQQMHLRIGLNAGEPIEEEDDLFGTTVQLAARVCAKSNTDEILCTNVVRELAAGKGLVFDSHGNHDLKGFKDQVALYRVLWNAADAGPAGGDGSAAPAAVKAAPRAAAPSAAAPRKPAVAAATPTAAPAAKLPTDSADKPRG